MKTKSRKAKRSVGMTMSIDLPSHDFDSAFCVFAQIVPKPNLIYMNYNDTGIKSDVSGKPVIKAQDKVECLKW